MMNTKADLVKLIITVSLISVVTSCGNSKDGNSKDKNDTAVVDSAKAASAVNEEQPVAGTEEFKEFDWNVIPKSSAQIGVFPYISAPDGFYIQHKDSSDESKTGYSELKDFDKLIMYDGKSFYNIEGKVARLKFRMKDRDAEFNQYKFDNSVEKYLSSIGTKLFGKIKITESQKAFLNKENDLTIYHHVVGDPYNDPVRCYALNTDKGKIMFQVHSNSAEGSIAVVEQAAFEQTIKAPTAAQ
jgi:OOP family OmpA-OmpF porin